MLNCSIARIWTLNFRNCSRSRSFVHLHVLADVSTLSTAKLLCICSFILHLISFIYKSWGFCFIPTFYRSTTAIAASCLTAVSSIACSTDLQSLSAPLSCSIHLRSLSLCPYSMVSFRLWARRPRSLCPYSPSFPEWYSPMSMLIVQFLCEVSCSYIIDCSAVFLVLQHDCLMELQLHATTWCCCCVTLRAYHYVSEWRIFL